MKKTLLFICVLLAAGGALMLAKKAYFDPRYGGIMGFVGEGMGAASEMEQVEGLYLGQIKSALSIYYGDTGGRYPSSLDVLWLDKKYLDAGPFHADVYLEAGGGKFKRAHWYRDTDKIRMFSSRAQADDGGGWGYVNDPNSPEFGKVFVNCTHLHWVKRVPWNLATEEAPAESAPKGPPR